MPAAAPSSLPFSLDATIDVETPEQITLTYTLAGFGSRALAAVLDTMVIIALLIGLTWATVAVAGRVLAMRQMKDHLTGSAWAFAIIALLEFAVVWGYYVFFEGLNDGQTPGKRVMQLRVVRDGGYSVTFAASAVRNLARVVDFLPTFYATGAILVLVTKSGKRLGDLLAGTFVVHEGKTLPTSRTTSAHASANTSESASLLPILNDAEYELLERYATRRAELTPERRRVLAEQVGQRLKPHLEANVAVPAALMNLFTRERTARATSVAGRSDTGTRREQHAIVALGLARWNEFAKTLAEVRRSGLRKLTETQVADFVERYRQLSADLARLQTASRGRRFDALFFVSRLVAGGHAVLYRQRGQGFTTAMHYMTVDVPREIRRSVWPIALAAVCFFVPAIITYAAVVHDPVAAKDAIPEVMTERAERGREHIQRHKGYVDIPEEVRPVAASFIIKNNIGISYVAFAFGLTAGIGTIFMLVVNGVGLGAGAGIFAVKGVASLLWAFVAPHGVLELSAICLAGGGGLLIASAIVLPGNMTRREALIQRGRRAIRLVAAATLFLLVAGTIEGLISPRVWPIAWKLAVSGATALAMIAYISLAWRTQAADVSVERGVM